MKPLERPGPGNDLRHGPEKKHEGLELASRTRWRLRTLFAESIWVAGPIVTSKEVGAG